MRVRVQYEAHAGWMVGVVAGHRGTDGEIGEVVLAVVLWDDGRVSAVALHHLRWTDG